MQRILFLFLVALVSFTACKKDSNGLLSATSGRWQWDHSYGGLAPATITASANTAVVLILKEDMTYRIEKNGQVAVSDSFTTQTINGEESFKFKNLSTVDNLTMYMETGIKIENGQLVLTDLVSDGLKHYFKK